MEDVRQERESVYFKNRTNAGYLLSQKLLAYKNSDSIVLALSEGAILVAAEVAKALDSPIALLMTRDVYLPDGRTVVGIVNEAGGFIYNNSFSAGEIEDFESEYRNNIEFAKMQAMHDIHLALGRGGLISPDYFRNRNVIVISDGSLNGMAFDTAYDFLKTIHCKRIVMATPVAGIPAIDRMHILSDELHCLIATDSVFDIDHYYDDNKIPEREEIISILNDINWHKKYSDPNTNSPYLSTANAVTV